MLVLDQSDGAAHGPPPGHVCTIVPVRKNVSAMSCASACWRSESCGSGSDASGAVSVTGDCDAGRPKSHSHIPLPLKPLSASGMPKISRLVALRFCAPIVRAMKCAPSGVTC